MSKPRLVFIVESGTDVRMVEGLAEHFQLTLLARTEPGASPVSQPNARRAFDLVRGPVHRIRFAAFVGRWLRANSNDAFQLLVQGYGFGAFAAQTLSRGRGRNTAPVLLLCSPWTEYYRCRREARDPRKPFRPAEYALLRTLAAWNLRRARRLVVLSRYLGEIAQRGGATAPAEVIPVYGVDTEVFCPSHSSRAETRSRLGLDPAERLVFFSSRVAPEKDERTLLEALRRLRDASRPIRLLHLSGGHGDFRSAAVAAGVQDHVIAADAVDPRTGLAAYYRAADVCVQSSRDEGLGFSVLEAMACGTPVVASAVGGLRETVLDRVTGRSCPAGDPARLAEAMEWTLFQDPEQARALAQAGASTVRRSFERNGVFRRLAEALLGNRAAGPPGTDR